MPRALERGERGPGARARRGAADGRRVDVEVRGAEPRAEEARRGVVEVAVERVALVERREDDVVVEVVREVGRRVRTGAAVRRGVARRALAWAGKG